ncbi:MAG: LysM peptidoglycan-binding domain-containing protein [Halioglobus sp.]|nr:LysM peptidoglycan-binding domain-containing protein [Halioglobus sp.]
MCCPGYNARIDAQRLKLLQQPNYLQVIAKRAHYYLFHITEEVSARGMPMEIALIPVVESTLDPFAFSYSGAAGLWQIMPRTGRHLGLMQNAWYDGRQSLRDSTDGALDYLQFLHDAFDGDWLLAVAAYNAGEGTIRKARRNNASKGLATDYWSLTLRREAYEYIPKIIAVAQIIATPDHYGLTIPFVANAPAFEIAQTDTTLHLDKAAQLAGADLETVRALNPGQLRDRLSPLGSTELLLPMGTRDDFHANLAQLEPNQGIPTGSYYVRNGDTLWDIARRLGTDIAVLRAMNDLRGDRIRAGDTLVVPNKFARADTGGNATDYRVRAGDSLYRIASRFQVSVSKIIDWNRLDPDAYLQPGQQLTLYISDS